MQGDVINNINCILKRLDTLERDSIRVNQLEMDLRQAEERITELEGIVNSEIACKHCGSPDLTTSDIEGEKVIICNDCSYYFFTGERYE